MWSVDCGTDLTVTVDPDVSNATVTTPRLERYHTVAAPLLHRYHTVTVDPDVSNAIAIATGSLIVLGVLLVPVATLAMLAAQRESRQLLSWFSNAVMALILVFVAFAAFAFYAATPLDGFVDSNCANLTQFGAASWFERLAPGASCVKYYGQGAALRNGSLVAGTELGLAPGVGEIVSCFNESDIVYAWEYNLQSQARARAPAMGGSSMPQ